MVVIEVAAMVPGNEVDVGSEDLVAQLAWETETEVAILQHVVLVIRICQPMVSRGGMNVGAISGCASA